MANQLSAEPWVWVRSSDIGVELQQCADEGRELGALRAEGRDLQRCLKRQTKNTRGVIALQDQARRWLARTLAVRERGGYHDVKIAAIARDTAELARKLLK